MVLGRLAVSALLATAWTAPVMAGTIDGVWRSENRKVTIRLAACGSKLCGRIVGLQKPLAKDGKPKRDSKNPNPALRGRQVIGITVLSGLTASGDGEWQGAIYNPDDGRTYRSTLKRLADDRIVVNGCVAVLCKSVNFRKVD